MKLLQESFLPRPPNSYSKAFTLAESVIAAGIVSTVLLALVGLIPAALDASRDASVRTLVSVVLEDVHGRLQGLPLDLSSSDSTHPGPFFYDENGILVARGNTALPDDTRPYFRVDVTLSALHPSHLPQNTSSLVGIQLEVSWPLDASGNATGSRNPQSVTSYQTSAVSGPQWNAIDATYTPTIEL